ncbi:DUF397 domain-containing protein [Actinomadura oligospora]|uniref:DUF397 domain-containing protein n=1 Tax=Actinomadura oligospora TaxID=111804 RepID=UPI00047DBD23|nr:DUF397 domain-containing protein [Actinomadura oligospora]
MASTPEISNLDWRKSTYSTPTGSDCVEVADAGSRVAVRDSKNPSGPKLIVHPADWHAFATALKERGTT